ncbi:MAG: hypothetical protein AABX70_02575 [Nanoarchaeota archaeon]
MSLDKKVRFEYDQLNKEKVIERVEKEGFEVISLKYTQGLFGKYVGPNDEYQKRVESLEKEGIKTVYRESNAKE